jgi:gliding motility-associated protein GldM
MLALNVSAEVIEAFKTVDKSLIKSNTNLEASTSSTFGSLAEKVKDPQVNKEKLDLWTKNANQAKKLSDDLNAYIDGLKNEMKVMSGFKNEKDDKGEDKFKDDDLNASSNLMDNQKKGLELDQKLKAYRTAMLAIDPAIAAAYEKNFPIEIDSKADADATTKSFRMMPTVAAVTLLSKYQNNVKNAENQVVNFCHDQVSKVKVIYNQFAAIVGQSSNYVMPGEKVTIRAGVGAFSTEARPVISIGGSSIPVDAEGVAEKEFVADGGGEKSIAVNVSYTTPDGKTESKPYTIKYTVGTPGGAAVMLDKMNVFYIGVDNPVTIGSPTGWDKTTVTPSGCTITGNGSKRVVRVSAIGAASLTVVADGKSSKFDFRIKRIPDPILKVGPSGGGKIQAVIFRNQQFLRADLENFDFEAKFNVVGGTVYFNIPGDRNVNSISLSSGDLGAAKQYMSKLVPGSIVTFDNVRVVGPDGQTRTIQTPPYFQLF